MRRTVTIALVIYVTSSFAMGWGAHGHRTITYLALDGLPRGTPDWLRDVAIRDRIADHSNTPDRWRSMTSDILGHSHKMEHYMNSEDLASYGLTLRTVPRLRYEYLRVLILAKEQHPERFSGYDPSRDSDRTREWPGFALHGMAEQYAKLQASFNIYRTLERLNDPHRAHQLEQARQNIIYHMGILSHYVGDMAQPLHTTRHYNGWVGENPNNYVTNPRFHSYIDTNIVEHHKLTYETLRPLMTYRLRVRGSDPWNDLVTYVERSLGCVEPLYQIERDGQLHGDVGKQFITDRLVDGGELLAALYLAAWQSSGVNRKQEADFVGYDRLAQFPIPTLPPPDPRESAEDMPTDEEPAPEPPAPPTPPTSPTTPTPTPISPSQPK